MSSKTKKGYRNVPDRETKNITTNWNARAMGRKCHKGHYCIN